MLSPRLASRAVRAVSLAALGIGALGAPPGCILATGGIETPGGACGDGTRQDTEPCDGDDLGGKTCEALAFGPGTLTCSSACAFDTHACGPKSTCGDGKIGPGEACDGTNLDGKDCKALGHAAGELVCTAQCGLDASGCVDAPPGWLDVAWARRRTLTIHEAKVAEDLTAFEVLVDIKEVGLGAAKEDGSDLVFTASDGKTKLAHEIESFSGSPPRLIAWVSVPMLSSTANTVLYLYYENPAAPPPAPSVVWDAGYASVYHLAEPFVAGDGGQHHDATGHGHDGTQHGNASGPGKIGLAQRFDGKDDYVDLSHPEEVVLGNADATISAWINTSSKKAMGILLKSKDTTHEQGDKLFGLNKDAHKLGQDQGWVAYIGGTTDIDNGLWHHVVWTQKKDLLGENEQWTLYVDGAKENEKGAVTLPDVAGHTLRIGFHVNGSFFDQPFDGAIDELRISAVTRTSGWVSTSFANQSDPGAFLAIGAEETLPK